MREKEDKLRMMKRILVDDNSRIPSKEQIPGSATKVISPERERISRKVLIPFFLFKYLLINLNIS